MSNLVQDTTVMSVVMVVLLTTFSPWGVKKICMIGEKTPTGMENTNQDPEKF